jgi:hypothetical protein
VELEQTQLADGYAGAPAHDSWCWAGRARYAIRSPGGIDAVNLRVAEEYVSAFGKLAKTNNSIIVPADLGDMSGLIASALQIVKAQK